MTDLFDGSATSLRRALARGEVSALEVTNRFLDRIQGANGTLGALQTVTPELARECAATLDAARAGGDDSAEDLLLAPLWGVPFADKDLVDRIGVPTSCGSRANVRRPATVSGRLVRDMDAAGGVSLGKTLTPEFGLSCSSENALGNPARNPWDLGRTAGGSSAGAAVAVASGMLPWTPGSDGGGSIRIPAAACGIIGLKASRGRIPGASGVDQLAGLPVAGTLTRTVADAALLLDGMMGNRRLTSAVSAPPAPPSFAAALADAPTARRLRIGVSDWSPWSHAMDISWSDAAIAALEDAARNLGRMGHSVERAPIPPEAAGYADAFRTVWEVGAASIALTAEQLERVEPLTAWLVERGRTTPATDLASALAWLGAFAGRVIESYAPFDAILTPVLEGPAWKLGSLPADDGERNFAAQCRFAPSTSYVNVAGLPAIAVPVGVGTLPVGVQLIGRPGDELGLLVLAQDLEREGVVRVRQPPYSVLGT